ncbi:V-set and immunoglobulin domain-containing protein 10 [Anguilla rostrata]|uniref:V-set and immunoglobulin domain-containing protein 10 n=1 Tax=Anguilla rostrata TaxID=7938 RepID=UPI0030CBD6CE
MGRSVSLFLLLAAHLTGVAIGQTLEKIVGTLGDTVSLPCHGIPSNGTLPVVQWLKDGGIAASRNLSSVLSPSGNMHFSISDQGNLTITGLLLSDEGIYRCCDYVLNRTTEKQTHIQLLIVSGPTDVSTDVKPAAALPNGTLFVQKDSTISFNCSSESYPSQVLSWVFQGSLLSSGNKSSLEFSIPSIQPTNQGMYSCISQNALSNQTASKSTSLLVYYAPDRHPECYCNAGNDSLQLLLHCSWPGSYPLPMLHWEAQLDARGTKQSILNVSVTAESLEVTLNRSQLYNGQTVECKAHNQVLNSEAKFCSITLRAPFPQGDPMVTVVEGRNVTLTCSESSSLPPAKTTWRRKISQEEIVPGTKYVVSELGPAFSLQIVNVTKEDEGPYFCRSENPLMVQELEVYLTVKSSESYAGGVVGAFIAALIIGIGIAIGTSAYHNRDRICLGGDFG